jgi:hypothetical protein
MLKRFLAVLESHKYHKNINIDGDIIFSKELEPGIESIIIYDDDTYAYSFIGNVKGNELKFFKKEEDLITFYKQNNIKNIDFR